MAVLTQDNLMKLFGENWAHIRHMEYYRMWCVNIYAAVVASLALAFGTGKIERYFGYVAAFLALFTISNLLITLKIEAVIDNFVEANEIIAAELEAMAAELETMAARLKTKPEQRLAPIRTRKGFGRFIRFQWLFTAFYLFVLMGIAVLIALH